MPSRSSVAPAPTYTIAVYDGDLDRLGALWQALEPADHPGTPFRSWAWNSAWWKLFSRDRKLCILTAHPATQSGEPVALLPLFQEPTPFGGARLAFLGEGQVGSDYLGIVGSEHPEVTAAFVQALHERDSDRLELDALMEGDPLLDALAAAPFGARATVEARYRCPYVRIEGSFSDFLYHLPEGAGAQLKRRRTWLEKNAQLRFEHHRDREAIAKHLPVLFRLHHLRWAVEGGSDAIDGAEIEEFHRQTAAAFADRGWAQLSLLYADGEPRAASYGFRHGRRFSFYQSGYDPDYRQRSVGTVLLGELMAQCFAEGLSEFDFLHGSEPYKFRWANGCRETRRVQAVGSSWRAQLHSVGRSAYWGLRAATKRALPEVALDWVRRTRRKVTR